MIYAGDDMKISALWHDDTALGARKRLFLLFMLNISDWICTLSLLKTGLFKEANPLMSGIISNVWLGLLVKAGLPLALILFALTKVESADSRQLLLSNNIALVGVSVYFLLNLYHISCFALVRFFYL